MYFETFRNHLIGTAAIATLMGVIAILAHINSIEEIGRGLALCLLCAFYAATLIVIVVLPMRATLKKRLEEGK